MIIHELIDFEAFTGKEKRNLYVYLPAGYEKNTDKKYPVLYMFDGQNIFFDEDATYGRSWRLGEYLDKNKIDLIVVALECHRGCNGERMIEYSPYDKTYKRVKYKGYGDKTMKWFIKTLKPMIDEEFRTLSDRKHTFVGGSSMGGIFASYCLLRYNRVFSRAISMSPAYLMFKKEFYKTIKQAKITKDSVLYTDYGTKDLEVPKALELFHKVNLDLSKLGVNVTSRQIWGGLHCEETWDKQLVFAINTIMYDLD